MKNFFYIILLFAVLFTCNNIYSQVGVTINGGLQIPAGDFSNLVNNGYGFTASLDYSIPLVPIGLSLMAGYDNWAYKTQYSLSNSGLHEFGNGINLYAIPVTLGPKLFIKIPGAGFVPYIGIDAGAVFLSSTAAGAGSSTDFFYSPVIGFRFSLPTGIIAIDINIRESNMVDNSSSPATTSSWIGINGGITISM
jgi:hypothetical protein